VLVRVNGPATPWGEADLEAAVACRPQGILLPKVSTAEDIAPAVRAIAAAGATGTALWAMIETPLSILNLREIGAAAKGAGLVGFVLGTNDLSKETGTRIVPGRAPLLPWLMQAVAAARAFGLAVLDGVYNDIDDDAGFAAECAAARDMGFDGKTVVHPKQIGPANDAFRPSPAEVAFAEIVVEAFARPENAGQGAIRIEGRMVERLHADMAARTLATARAVAVLEAAHG
jgi:citrate lyase subunit beta/citryl-CoA lyase